MLRVLPSDAALHRRSPHASSYDAYVFTCGAVSTWT